MKFQITSFPKEYYDSLVVEYHRKLPDGSRKIVKGNRIFPNDPEHVIGGLEPGDYVIAIKFDYEDKRPISEPATLTSEAVACLCDRPKASFPEVRVVTRDALSRRRCMLSF